MVSVFTQLSRKLRLASGRLSGALGTDPLQTQSPQAQSVEAQFTETQPQPEAIVLPNTLQALLQERPSFHAIYQGTQVIEAECCNWAIDTQILSWITAHVKPGAQTLETGCGYSSIAFALASSDHTVISPIAAEHQAIQRWCAQHDLDLSHVTFHAEQSQDVVHSQENTPLDVVLIDGNHAFPTPFIDWYYTADRIKENGYLLVDDTQLITGKILRDFLSMEAGRWQLEADLGQTAVFRKLTSSSVTRGFWWGMQPYCEAIVTRDA